VRVARGPVVQPEALCVRLALHMEGKPLVERMPPVVLALGAFIACLIAGGILLALGITFIGIIVLAVSPILALVVWLGAG